MAVRFIFGSSGSTAYKLFLRVNRVSVDWISVSFVINTNILLYVRSQMVVINV